MSCFRMLRFSLPICMSPFVCRGGTTFAHVVHTCRLVLLSAILLMTGFHVSLAQTISSFTISPSSVQGKNSATGTVVLSSPAPMGGLVIDLHSDNPQVATCPSTVTIAAGTTTNTYPITTCTVNFDTVVTFSAQNVSANLTVTATWDGLRV